jgi:hypothetical protein
MNTKYLLLLLIFCSALFSARAQIAPDANPLPSNLQLPFSVRLPNTSWYLAQNDAPDHYIFKRKPLFDPQGQSITPAIIIYVETKDDVKAEMGQVYTDHPVNDLRDYFEAFWSAKMTPMEKNGIKISKISTIDDKDYPLSYRNISVFVKGGYSLDGFDHILYMAYIMDKQNRGIQVYMDMTTGIQNVCDKEFMDFIRSLKEI